ncbi:MAG: GGDEF domain-containing protein [Treponema sp.]|nr:GGDEF domain-containing protein [Candidatus Treponema equifaecale]
MGYEVKKIYLNENLDIIEGNREYFIYFERVGHRFSKTEELVLPSEKDDFVAFLKKGEKGSSAIFHFKKYTDEFRLNKAVLTTETLHNTERLCLKLTDLDECFEYLDKAAVEMKKQRAAMSIIEDYFFSYEKSTNKFKIIHYHDSNIYTDFNSDIDEWKDKMISEGYVPDDQIRVFYKFVTDLKSCLSKIFVKLNCGFRTSGKIMQNLNLIGTRFEDDNGNVSMIGRLLEDSNVNSTQNTNHLMNELQYDPLTKCFNKKTIVEIAHKKMHDAEPNEKIAMIIVDLDNFKPVNDAYGHLAGDRVLEQAGEVLRAIVAGKGCAGRYGGDEFLLIVNHMDDEETLRGTLQTILNNIRTQFENSFDDIKITPSIGASVYPTNAETFEELFNRADFCLYRAKDKGRNRYVFFREDLHLELYKKSVESTSGVKYQGREIQELKYMAQFMHNLSAAPFKSIKDVLSHMVETYSLADISIYYGEDLSRIYTVGEKRDCQNEAEYARSELFKTVLKGSRYVRMDFPEDISSDAKAFTEILNQRGIKSTIQCILGTPDDIKGLVTFDKTKEAQQWAEYEVNCAVMFASSFNLLPESTKIDFALYSKLKN